MQTRKLRNQKATVTVQYAKKALGSQRAENRTPSSLETGSSKPQVKTPHHEPCRNQRQEKIRDEGLGGNEGERRRQKTIIHEENSRKNTAEGERAEVRA